MPRLKPVLAQRLFTFLRHRSEKTANLGAAAKEERRLATHDVEVLFFGNVRVAVLGELVELAFDHF